MRVRSDATFSELLLIGFLILTLDMVVTLSSFVVSQCVRCIDKLDVEQQPVLRRTLAAATWQHQRAVLSYSPCECLVAPVVFAFFDSCSKLASLSNGYLFVLSLSGHAARHLHCLKWGFTLLLRSATGEAHCRYLIEMQQFDLCLRDKGYTR